MYTIHKFKNVCKLNLKVQETQNDEFVILGSLANQSACQSDG